MTLAVVEHIPYHLEELFHIEGLGLVAVKTGSHNL